MAYSIRITAILVDSVTTVAEIFKIEHQVNQKANASSKQLLNKLEWAR